MRYPIKTRREVNGLRRASGRLQLEALEVRLSLGDTVLGAVVGSSFFGSAMSSWNPSQRDRPAPAEPPVAARRLGSIFQSWAFERRNWIALAPSWNGAGAMA